MRTGLPTIPADTWLCAIRDFRTTGWNEAIKGATRDRMRGTMTRVCPRPALLLGSLFFLSASFIADGEAATGTRVRISTAYESWDHEVTSLDELTSYLSLSAPIGRHVRLDLLTGHAMATGDDLGDASGLLNTRARITYKPASSLALRIGLSVPTGLTELNEEELAVARVLSDRIRGYRGPKLGEGLGLDLGAAYSVPVGPVIVGVGTGFRIRGEYDVAEGLRDYDPGDQASFSLGLDLGGRRWLWRLDGVHVRYQSDEAGGTEVYRIGPRTEVRGLVTWRGDRTTGTLRLQTIQMGKNEIPGLEGLEPEPENSNPPEFYLEAALSRMLSRRFSVLLFGGGRIFEEAESGEGGAQRFDAGLGAGIRMTRSITVTLRAGYAHAVLDLDAGDEEIGGALATISMEGRL